MREPHPALHLAKFGALALSLAYLSGCATDRALMPTPSIYEGGDALTLFDSLPDQQRQPGIELIFATDRAANTDPEIDLPYGAERSREIAFGTVRVEMGPELTWDDVVRQSQLGQRTEPVNLTLGPVTEIGRFPATPYPMQIRPEGIFYDAAVLAEHERMTREFLATLDERLSATQRKEILLYVHGFNETFDSAAFSLAELCHFLGRDFACVMFSWPAGSGGNLLTGYGRDRESSEFGMFHLKRVIRLIGQSQQAEELHLVAHSRGTDVLLSALRELAIENHAAGIPASASKLGHIILLAPDVDQELAAQRVAPIPADPDIATVKSGDVKALPQEMRATIYVSPEDRALLASALLFRSNRLGRFDVNAIDEDMANFWKSVGQIQIIQAPSKRTDRFGHSYFTSNATVSSDLIQLLRYDRSPDDPERSLKPVLPPLVWKIVEPD